MRSKTRIPGPQLPVPQAQHGPVVALHGSAGERLRLEILIRTEKTADGSLITVEDNGPGFAPQTGVEDAASKLDSGQKDTHIGLANVRERLELMCKGTLSAAPGPEGGTSVTIIIPDEGYSEASSKALK